MRTPFDLQRFINGEPAVTRDGVRVRYVAHVPDATPNQRVVFMLMINASECRYVNVCSETGAFGSSGAETCLDLFMAPRVAIAA